VLDACAVAIAAREAHGSVPEGTPPLDTQGVCRCRSGFSRVLEAAYLIGGGGGGCPSK
jgi:hypothetical protein